MHNRHTSERNSRAALLRHWRRARAQAHDEMTRARTEGDAGWRLFWSLCRIDTRLAALLDAFSARDARAIIDAAATTQAVAVVAESAAAELAENPSTPPHMLAALLEAQAALFRLGAECVGVLRVEREVLRGKQEIGETIRLIGAATGRRAPDPAPPVYDTAERVRRLRAIQDRLELSPVVTMLDRAQPWAPSEESPAPERAVERDDAGPVYRSGEWFKGRYGITTASLRVACNRGRVQGIKIGGRWHYEVGSVALYKPDDDISGHG